MRERDLENRLSLGIQKLGGRAYKFVSPGNTGVPDRLVILPGGRILFVELKTDAGRLTRLQDAQISALRGLGCLAVVVRGAEGVRTFLAYCKTLTERGDDP